MLIVGKYGNGMEDPFVTTFRFVPEELSDHEAERIRNTPYLRELLPRKERLSQAGLGSVC